MAPQDHVREWRPRNEYPGRPGPCGPCVNVYHRPKTQAISLPQACSRDGGCMKQLRQCIETSGVSNVFDESAVNASVQQSIREELEEM
jgi:hypothetical protein